MDLTTIIVIIVSAIAFVCMVTIFYGMASSKKDKAKPASKPEETKQEEKPKEESAEEDHTASIEEINKATYSNYMRQRAEVNQNDDFTMDDVKETRDNLRGSTKIHRIEAIEETDDSTDIDDILNNMDRDGNEPQGETVLDEFRKLSPKMKTIIITDALKRKDDDNSQE